MGEADRYIEYSRQPRFNFRLGADGNAVMNLFAINSVMFVLFLFIQVGYNGAGKTTAYFEQEVFTWLGVSGSGIEAIKKPWTLLSYVFTDKGTDIWRFVSNMIWLWAFGTLLQNVAGNRRIMPIYVYGGLLGGLLFVAAHYIFPSLAVYRNQSLLLGANAGIMALAGAALLASPQLRLFQNIGRGIPLWTVIVLYFVIDIIGVKFSPAYMLAHAGGAVAGIFVMYFLSRGKDITAWMINGVNQLGSLLESKATQRVPKEKVFYNTTGRKPYQRNPIVTQQMVDEILDKITQKGYHRLTEEEKEILRKASEGND